MSLVVRGVGACGESHVARGVSALRQVNCLLEQGVMTFEPTHYLERRRGHSLHREILAEATRG